jgi:hypothetical protein
MIPYFYLDDSEERSPKSVEAPPTSVVAPGSVEQNNMISDGKFYKFYYYFFIIFDEITNFE